MANSAQNSSIMSKTSSGSVYGLPTWFHNLPVNVLLNIFRHFDRRDLQRNISLVCKRWRYVSKRPELWKKLCVRGRDAPTEFICQRIRDLKFLEAVHLDDILEPVVVIRQVCRWIPGIKQLGVRNCHGLSEAVLLNAMQSCKQLESLDLRGTSFRAHRFYEEIAGLVHLRSIDLSKNFCLSTHNLLSIILNCHNLEELKLSAFKPPKPLQQLNDEDISFIIRNHALTLKTLSLDASTLTDFSFKAIMTCTRLEKLSLHGAANLSAGVFVEMWMHLPSLVALKVQQAHQITGQSIAQLFTAGKHALEHVRLLDFTGCWKVTDVGMDALAQCCKNLETLILKSCKNISNLGAVCNNCKTLKKLNIAFCTHLNLESVFPLPQNLNILVIDKSERFYDVIHNMTEELEDIHITMCVSEYNDDILNYTFR